MRCWMWWPSPSWQRPILPIFERVQCFELALLRQFLLIGEGAGVTDGARDITWS